MHAIGTITSRFQIYLPISIRRATGITRHGKVVITAKDNKITIEPLPDDFLSLGGKYKTKNPIPAETIRDYIDYENL